VANSLRKVTHLESVTDGGTNRPAAVTTFNISHTTSLVGVPIIYAGTDLAWPAAATAAG